MSAHAQAPGSLSTAQLSELALDAAIEVEDFMKGRTRALASTRQLIDALMATLSTGDTSTTEGRIDLAYLPIYESAVDAVHEASPKHLSDFTRKVKDILAHFSSAGEENRDILENLREFCLAVHDQALSQRIDAVRSSRPRASYASRPF